MNSTPRNICQRSLRLIGALGAGQTSDGTDITDAFIALQEMMDGWLVDNLTVIVTERALFPLVVGKGGFENPYTIGPGGDFDRARPIWLDTASVITLSNASQPLELPIDVYTVGQYQSIPVKNTGSGIVSAIYYDFAYNMPDGLGRIYTWPIPNVTYLKLALYCPTSITAFTSLDQVYNFPPAYLRAIRYNLAVDLMPEWGAPDNADEIKRLAMMYKAEIERANIRPVIIGVDEALVRPGDKWNWLTGDYRK